MFSTHNQGGPGHGEKLSLGFHRTRNPVKLAKRLLRAALFAGKAIRNYGRYARLRHDGEDYSIRNASAHDHGIVIHYITLENQLRQLESVGFQPNPLVFASSDGRRLSAGDNARDVWWFHLVVRK